MDAKHYCTQEEYANLESKAGIPQQRKELDDLTAQLNQISRVTSSLSGNELRENAIKSINLSSVIQNKQSDLSFNLNQLDRECFSLGDTRFYKEQKEFLDSLQKQRQDISNTVVSCPTNATLNNGSCFCNEGYIANGQGCVTYTQNCQSKYGPNSYGDKSTCRCLTDYSFDASKNICVKNEYQPKIPAKDKQLVEMTAPKEAEVKQVKPVIKNKETGEIISNNAIITPSAGEVGDRSEPPKKQNFVGKIFSSIKNFIFNIFK